MLETQASFSVCDLSMINERVELLCLTSDTVLLPQHRRLTWSTVSVKPKWSNLRLRAQIAGRGELVVTLPTPGEELVNYSHSWFGTWALRLNNVCSQSKESLRKVFVWTDSSLYDQHRHFVKHFWGTNTDIFIFCHFWWKVCISPSISMGFMLWSVDARIRQFEWGCLGNSSHLKLYHENFHFTYETDQWFWWWEV